MSLFAYAVTVIIINFILANIPWFSNQLFFIFHLPKTHTSLWRLLQWLVYLIIAYIISISIENYVIGTVFNQDWEFYSTFVLLFITYAFPGFLYRLYKG